MEATEDAAGPRMSLVFKRTLATEAAARRETRGGRPVASAASSMDGSSCRLLLARHGETHFNADGRIQGTLETELTEQGHAQRTPAAHELSEEFEGGGAVLRK